tara:strand:- start:30707 stop:31507 length:801 start_codon:yes stop_codon:yes gene_type:complete
MKKLPAGCLSLLLMLPVAVQAEKTRQPEGVGIDQKLSAPVALDTKFYNEDGELVELSTFFDSDRRPVIIAPAFYECAMLCTAVFDGISRAMSGLAEKGLVAGEDYRVLSVSFDPEDTPQMARTKGTLYRSTVKNQKVGPEGWHFLTGTQDNIKPLMDSMGYNYKPDGEVRYSHPAAIMLITPAGEMSRYLFGIKFDPTDLRLSLVEASSGKIGTLTDAFLLTCFRFDPQKGKYTPFAMGFMQIGGMLIFFFLVGLVLFLYLRERNT